MALEEDFRQAMSRFAGAVTAITTQDADGPAGLIATAVCSLSAQPPSILVCVNRSASAHDAIVRNGSFAVNLLRPEQRDVVDSFTRFKGGERFAASGWRYDSGVPFLDDAIVSMRCTLKEALDGFSHSIMIGVIEEIRFSDDHAQGCLLWLGKGLHRALPLVAADSNGVR